MAVSSEDNAQLDRNSILDQQGKPLPTIPEVKSLMNEIVF